MYFQDLILTLQRYWNDRGCLFVQPYDSEKGAATFNPATWLRALGPEPFYAAFAEPCRRPTDGRYGDNPIRMQHYFQYQVVLKPSPADILDQYLGSLDAIGIRSSEHDIRFVHDDWESPTLGAWGLGWEVWLDGMEVTQFTYFQQVGGIELSPVTGEITYGAERLCMFLQGVDSVFDLQYNAMYTYGDIFHRNEVLGSRHNFEQADVELQFELFRRYEAESTRLAGLANPVAAADYCLKASHAFNMLDARGAISVNERQNYILRVRTIARGVAEAWLADREALGFPWQHKPLPGAPAAAAATPDRDTAAPPPVLPERAPLLVELGVEEMPAAVFDPLLAQLPDLFAKHIGALDLDAQDVTFYATPRRIVISVNSLRTAQPDQHQVMKGPPLRVARDADGRWTKAAEAFAQRQGLSSPDALDVREDGGADYLFAAVHQAGKPALELLAAAIPALFADIHWYKTMRWGSGDTHFVRPVQWLVALLGDAVVPTAFAGCSAGRQTRGHRFLSNHTVTVPADRDGYLDALRDRHVIVNQAERRELIRHAVTERAEEIGLRWRVDEVLLGEVTNLVEFVVPVIGSFEEDYLQIPDAVLVSEMRAHQRYLALENPDGTLSNHFMQISNTIVIDEDVIRAGYEKVLRSRFADARFFLAEDLKKTLDARVADLAQSLFQQKLGTILDKVNRIRALSANIAGKLGLSAEQRQTVDRIATLAKADLTTAMVYEFPELQGEVGAYYARKQGQPEIVAAGIREHYLPKGLSDAFPSSVEAAVVGLADRLDSLVGIFAIGKAPKSGDPFGLRRACLTSLALILNRDLHLDFAELLDAAMDTLDVDAIIAAAVATEKKPKLTSRDQLRAELLDFTLTRLTGLLESDAREGLPGGFAKDTVLATVQASATWYDVADLARRVRALQDFRARADFADLAATFKRVNNICDRSFGDAVDPSLFSHAKEAPLLAAIDAANAEVSAALARQDYVAALAAIVPLRASVDRFMDAGPMVNDPDPATKANRHRLLRRLLDQVLAIADFSAIA